MNSDLNKPLVSIITPAFNAEKYISETIYSVIHQTYSNWEMIIVNDGSEDRTRNIIEAIQKTESRIILLNKENSGVSKTRNFGLHNANGSYIAFLDADDIWCENNLYDKVEFLRKNPEYDYVFSNMNLINESSDFIGKAPVGKGEDILKNLLLWNGEVIPGPCSNLILKATSKEKIIFFNEDLSTIADQYFSVQLSKNLRGFFLQDYLFNYRVVGNSMSKSLKLQETDAITAFKLYKVNNLFESNQFKRKCFANMYLILAGSWWKDGRDKIRGSYFIAKAFLEEPIFVLQILLEKFLKSR